MTTSINLQGYYNRYSAANDYDALLFRAGYVLQSAELNELQSQADQKLADVASAILHDGDVVSGCAIAVDASTGACSVASGKVFIAGSVRNVPSGSVQISVIGSTSVGVYMQQVVVTELQDPSLLDPAVSVRNYKQPGAARLQTVCQWGPAGANLPGDYYPIYYVTNGALQTTSPPPQLDAVATAIASYDRDNSGGNYVVSGLDVQALPLDASGNQIFSIGAGKARVNGYAVSLSTSIRLANAQDPDLLPVTSEPTQATSSPQTVSFALPPAQSVTTVQITTQNTATLTHGSYTGCADALPNTSVLSIVSVKQGTTTYTAGSDYLLTGDSVDWSPGGAEPATGSTYDVVYQFIEAVQPSNVTATNFSVAGAVPGTLILTSYVSMLPRIDLLCLYQDGSIKVVKGQGTLYSPQMPSVPPDAISLAAIYQNWTGVPTVQPYGTRTVTMQEMSALQAQLNSVAELLALTRLQTNANQRAQAPVVGVYVDPFLDDSQRDAGVAQTAVVMRGVLTLPVTADSFGMGSDVSAPAVNPSTNVVAISQTLRTGVQSVNPYQNFTPPPAQVSLNPAVDRFTQYQSGNIGSSTEYYYGQIYAPGGTTIDGTFYAHWSTVTSLSVNTFLAGSTVQQTNIRQIPVSFTIKGFGAGEILDKVLFDGVTVTAS